VSFLSELKRRNVFRVATVYAATAFVIVQVASATFEPLHLPPWAMTLVVVIMIVGFPIALVIAWAFELTAGGVQRTAPAEVAPPAENKWIGKRTVAAAAVLVILGMGLGAGWFLRPAASGLIGGGDEPVTLAVLPFENLSGDPATEPFVLGVHDDLLTHLSRFDDLRVISRTSVMEYRETTKNVRQIAAELDAGAIVEGGIQRAGNQVRINVQLIDARTDEHLWAETYERELTAENVFAIQAEIARSVAAALRAELSPSDVADLAGPHTSSLEALEAYHAGRRNYFEGARDEAAVRSYERAVELDPEFAEAWAGLASARSWMLRTGKARDTLPARQALDRARALDPDGIETRLASGFYHYYARADFARAHEELTEAQQLAPRSTEVIQALAAVERRLGSYDQAIEHFREAMRIDPRNPTTFLELGETFSRIRRMEEAREYLERAVRIAPENDQAANGLFGHVLWSMGDTASARRVIEERADLVDAAFAAWWRAELAVARRDYAAGTRAVEGVPGRPNTGPFINYGGYYTPALPLQRVRLAWLQGDAAAVERYAEESLRWADTSGFSQPGYDPWQIGESIHLVRAFAHAFRGDREAALAEAGQVRPDLARDAMDDAVIYDNLVVLWIVVGEKERALEGLERLLAVPSKVSATRLRLDPMYDSLRNEPRFQRLVSEGE
jgi:TolB-like protein